MGPSDTKLIKESDARTKYFRKRKILLRDKSIDITERQRRAREYSKSIIGKESYYKEYHNTIPSSNDILITERIEIFRENLKVLKRKIISLKYDMIYDYSENLTKVSAEFEELYLSYTNYEKMLKKLENIVASKKNEHLSKLRENQIKIKAYFDDMSSMSGKHQESRRDFILKYQKQIVPLKEKQFELMYPEYKVDEINKVMTIVKKSASDVIQELTNNS